MHGLLIVVASLAAEQGLQGASVGASIVAVPGLQSTGSITVHRLSWLGSCGIFPDQGSNQVSPALAGRLFTTKPLRKPSMVFERAIFFPVNCFCMYEYF